MAVQLDDTVADGVAALARIETDLLLEGVYQFYGDDLREHDRSILRSRLQSFLLKRGGTTISALQGDVLRDRKACDALLLELCSHGTSPFDQPEQFAGLRELAGPLLRSYAASRVWVAECTSPADVFALSILLTELGLYEKTQIFATASNEPLLRMARAGIFPAECVAQCEADYRASGGTEHFSTFCTVSGNQARFADFLSGRITWANHCLVTDSSFNEFQLIMCRQPMQDFGTALRSRALSLFNDSLVHFGILALDPSLKLDAMPLSMNFRKFPDHPGLYRHIR